MAQLKEKLKARKSTPGQMSLWEEWELPADEIQAVAKQFVLANCFNPAWAASLFPD